MGGISIRKGEQFLLYFAKEYQLCLKKIIPVIGIGASAGGLEPLEQFFNKVSNDSGFAYIIIQHLAPDYKSLMDELLARHTNLPIKVIEDGIAVEANTIYLNPPKYFVEISANKLYLKEKERKKVDLSNHFFLCSR